MTLTKMAYFSHFFLEIIIYAPLRSSRDEMSKLSEAVRAGEEQALGEAANAGMKWTSSGMEWRAEWSGQSWYGAGAG